MRDSIEYGLRHRQEALKYAMRFGRGIGEDTADEFVGMYVNDYTVDMGKKGKEGLLALQKAALDDGILPKSSKIEFVDM